MKLNLDKAKIYNTSVAGVVSIKLSSSYIVIDDR